MQTVKEQALVAIEKLIPSIMSTACLTDQRKIMCGLYFMKPQEIVDLQYFFGPTYFPMFPARHVCLDYERNCAGLIALAPALAMNCSAKIGALQMFPTSKQVVAAINLGQQFVIETSPNYMNTSMVLIETMCPYGFVVPTDPTEENIHWIAGTGCAIGEHA